MLFGKKTMFFGLFTHDGSGKQFECEPNVAHEFHVEKRFVRICSVLAEHPLHGRIFAGGWRSVFGYRHVS